jgi:hypothetical protein
MAVYFRYYRNDGLNLRVCPIINYLLKTCAIGD